MKAYWIAVYKGLKNVNNLQGYAEKATIAIKKYNGKFLVRGGKTKTLEGTPSPRTVLIEFPSIEDALNCYNSHEYQDAKKFAKEEFNRHIQIVEGI
tara:strand:- start:277 stop:564 length:288 start_codon:yes stop_codon:yes gene_type:complete